MQKLVAKLVDLPFFRKALEDNADLSAFKGKPSLRIICGVSSIAASYIVGWPLITFLGVVAVHYRRPMIAIVGGPLAYLFSHLVFLFGMYLAGARYSYIFMRWLARVTALMLLKHFPLPEDKTG